MTRSRRRDTSQSGQRVLIAVLALATTIAGLLAARAGAAEQARARIADQSLRQLAATAAWQYARRASEDVEHGVRMTLWPVVRHAAGPLDSLPDAEALLGARSAPTCDCPRPAAPLGFARLDLRRGELRTWRAELAAADTAWLRHRLAGLAAASATSATSRTAADRMALWTVETDGDSNGRSEPRVLMAAVMRAGDSLPVAVYGAVTTLASLAALLDSSAHEADLLPSAVTRGLPSDSVVSVVVLGTDGTLVYRTPGSSSATRFSARDSLTSPARGLIVEAALMPHAVAATGLTVRGAAGTPLLIGLFLLSATLMGVAFLQHRRGSALLRLREDFVASVSHELRTPLTLITAHAETLLMERETGATERQAFLRVVLREAHRLRGLVDNVLRVSVSDHGGGRLTPHRVSLMAVTESAVRDFEPLAAAHGSRLEIVGHPAGGTGAQRLALADTDAVRQILFNLLDNAVKYGRRDQVIRVTVGGSADRVELRVDDEGPGIPLAERERVFERYVRLHDTGRLTRTGGGIGLTVVREICERYGGSVTIVESPAGGASVRVALPAAADDRVDGD